MSETDKVIEAVHETISAVEDAAGRAQERDDRISVAGYRGELRAYHRVLVLLGCSTGIAEYRQRNNTRGQKEKEASVA